ncbi:zinc ribbon domain-containing protein [Glaciimonas sp. CA11.2]|uniref:FmdB family zinc ribbon protein n=1 Tax=unclassified Glaciimonas TaxID=2644401 RepID=UPI002AB4CFEA|nr:MULTISPECIES: FmdB family zinc ribbon protein [unclassified Glaciimonas]MDY7545521.1 zinc ribbon domain-containing protein [Glaciimonas sp. CA11.2]MEB0012792.1 zinc ribbon domain-containing protein [Glaciimonas sp. Cout2]MEB0082270.1 zinc ribbon domain-containing protein [Glaciimonas sp. Gout2]MEB0162662.1 zinc ribbon domain-containing protein [Glaciimonas sp. CA11.2]
MPIYAYRCEACGFAKDVLQKMSDAQLTVCPTCHQESFKKQVTAAGFQLKGTGWYVTDFRGGAATGKSATGASEEGGTSTATDSAVAATPAAAASTSAPASSNSAPASTAASASSGSTTSTSAGNTTASKTSSSTAT